MHGKFIEFYKHINKKNFKELPHAYTTGFYTDGKKSGEWHYYKRVYHIEGVSYVGDGEYIVTHIINYKNDLKHGMETTFDVIQAKPGDRIRKHEDHWSFGVIEKSTSYNKGGSIVLINQRQEITGFFKNGEIYEKKIFNEKFSIVKKWNRKGELVAEAIFRTRGWKPISGTVLQISKHGYFIEEYSNGKLIRQGEKDLDCYGDSVLQDREDTRKMIVAKIKEQNDFAELIGKEVTFTNSLGIKFVLIPPGKFVIGSPLNELDRREDEVQTEMLINEGFYMSEAEITQAQWLLLMKENKSKDEGALRPVTNITWHDAQSFIEKLNEKEKIEYRLPTEIEWEYACRSGTLGAYISSALERYAVYFNRNFLSLGFKTLNVKTKMPNLWGLYDMHGNAVEWCISDHVPYSEYNGINQVINNSKDIKVRRGGSAYGSYRACRSAARYKAEIDSSSPDTGFRIILPVKAK